MHIGYALQTVDSLNGENTCNSNMVVLLHVVQLISRKDQVLNLNSCDIPEFYVADCSDQQLQDIKFFS